MRCRGTGGRPLRTALSSPVPRENKVPGDVCPFFRVHSIRPVSTRAPGPNTAAGAGVPSDRRGRTASPAVCMGACPWDITQNGRGGGGTRADVGLQTPQIRSRAPPFAFQRGRSRTACAPVVHPGNIPCTPPPPYRGMHDPFKTASGGGGGGQSSGPWDSWRPAVRKQPTSRTARAQRTARLQMPRVAQATPRQRRPASGKGGPASGGTMTHPQFRGEAKQRGGRAAWLPRGAPSSDRRCAGGRAAPESREGPCGGPRPCPGGSDPGEKCRARGDAEPRRRSGTTGVQIGGKGAPRHREGGPGPKPPGNTQRTVGPPHSVSHSMALGRAHPREQLPPPEGMLAKSRVHRRQTKQSAEDVAHQWPTRP